MELYIIRHAQSTNNALMEDQHMRVADPDLTEIGHVQAERVAQFLEHEINLEELVEHRVDAPERAQPVKHQITHLFCSPMYRTLKTALPIARAFSLDPEIWPDIHEHGGIFLENGAGLEVFGGMTREQIQAEFPNYIIPHTITSEGWWRQHNGKEDLAACQARAIRVAEALRQRALDARTCDDKIALVTHGMFIDCLLKAISNTLPGPSFFYTHYNTAVTRLDYRVDGSIKVRYVNRVTHLSPELIT